MYKRQLDTYGMRYFNVFGRRQDPNGAYAAVIPKFIKQLMDGETPTINGDGRQSRDFTYVENVVEANLKACQASSEAAGEAFNIGAGGREFLIDVYHNICKALNKEVEPNFGPDRKGDIRDSNAVSYTHLIRALVKEIVPTYHYADSSSIISIGRTPDMK